MEAQAEGHGLWELPEGLLRVVLNKISAEDVACLRCTCKALAVVASDDAVWKDKFMEWQHASARWVTDGRSWLAKYSERKKMDNTVHRHLQDPWLLRDTFTIVRELRDFGEDTKDILLHDALEDGCLKAGQRYWASFMLREVASQLCAERMRSVLAPDAQQRPPIEEGAIMLAQIFYPLLNMGVITSFLEELAEEARRRLLMTEGAQEDPVASLEVLSELLFGKREDGREPEDEEAVGCRSAYARSTSLSGKMSELAVPQFPRGLGLKADDDVVYGQNPDSYILPHVLTARRGAPVSMSIIHAAVATKMGLPVQCVCTIKNGRPFGLLNQLGIPNALEERFIDICSGGALLTRSAMVEMELSYNPSFSPGDLRSLPFKQLYQLVYRNLVMAVRATLPPEMPNLPKCLVEFALSLHPTQALRQSHAQECLSLGDFKGARDFCAYLGPIGEGANLDWSTRIHELQRKVEPGFDRVSRRPPDGSLKHYIGQVVTCGADNDKAVIYRWETRCTAPEEWCAASRVDSLPNGRRQPFYEVLIESDNNNARTGYVAQDEIHTPLSPEQLSHPVWHFEVNKYFEGRCEGASRYEPNASLLSQYPEDTFHCNSATCSGQHLGPRKISMVRSKVWMQDFLNQP